VDRYSYCRRRVVDLTHSRSPPASGVWGSTGSALGWLLRWEHRPPFNRGRGLASRFTIAMRSSPFCAEVTSSVVWG
jgi:hypothetical protein